MTRKDAKKTTNQHKPNKRWIVVITAILLLGLTVTARVYWLAPEDATAEPTPVPISPNAITQKPTAKPAAKPTTQSAVRPVGQTSKLTVVAEVNNQQIKRNQLAQACLDRYGKEVLESFLNKKLIQQACKQHNIEISEQDVMAEIARMAKKFGLSTERWLLMLKQEREIDPTQYRNEIIWPTLALRQLAAEQIQVTQEQLDEAFESEFGPKVKVRIIAHSNLQRATALREQAIADPSTFGTLAKDHSEDQASASARGLIPPIRKHVGDPSLEIEVYSLKEGDISKIIEIGNQYVFVKCEKRISSTYVAPQFRKDAESRLRDQITENHLRSYSATIFQKLQDAAKITTLYDKPSMKDSHPGIVAMLNGQQITVRDLAEECIKRYGTDVLEGEINRQLLEQHLTAANKTVEQQDLHDEIARAAVSRGYETVDGKADVNAWLKDVTKQDGVTVSIYVKDAVWPSVALKKLVHDSINITTADRQKAFEANYGERVEILAIVLNNQRRANMVWELANNNSTDYFFGELATQYSIEPVSRANQGKVPPVRLHGGQPVLEEEAFSLATGELSGIVAVGGKYIIMRCLGRTVPVVDELEDVRVELDSYLLERKLHAAMTTKFDAIRDSANIINYMRPIQPASVSAPIPSTGNNNTALFPK
ncbi:MAG: peptidylprolyl isomerase [Pirellulaceae bacterium]|jgi:parvulin-like peptidyl-prolyl isomerase|nr:peptidylprolyl isomerase [Pirellulaceae bacterium]